MHIESAWHSACARRCSKSTSSTMYNAAPPATSPAAPKTRLGHLAAVLHLLRRHHRCHPCAPTFQLCCWGSQRQRKYSVSEQCYSSKVWSKRSVAAPAGANAQAEETRQLRPQGAKSTVLLICAAERLGHKAARSSSEHQPVAFNSQSSRRYPSQVNFGEVRIRRQFTMSTHTHTSTFCKGKLRYETVDEICSGVFGTRTGACTL